MNKYLANQPGSPFGFSSWGIDRPKNVGTPERPFLTILLRLAIFFMVLSPSGFPPALAPFNVRDNDSLEFELQPHETRSASMESSGVVRQSSPGSHVVPLFDQRFGWRDIAIQEYIIFRWSVRFIAGVRDQIPSRSRCL